jgi:hypothetical protein
MISIIVLLLSLSSLYFPLKNIDAAADDSFIQINPFLTNKDICGDNKDNDGNGFIDDNCGTKSLKTTYDLSGTISNITSLCHEGCEDE